MFALSLVIPLFEHVYILHLQCCLMASNFSPYMTTTTFLAEKNVGSIPDGV